MSPHPRRRRTTPVATCALTLVTLVASATAWAHAAGYLANGGAVAVMVGMIGVLCLASGARFSRAVRRVSGRQRLVTLLMAATCAVIAAAMVPLTVALWPGGTFVAPPPWSQLVFPLAYVPWILALSLVRQPIVAANRRSRVDVLTVELGALILAGVGIAGVVWNPTLDAGANIAYLAPVELNLLVIVGAYNVSRRAAITRGTLFACMAVSATALLIAGTCLAYAGTHPAAGGLTHVALTLYCVAVGALARGAGRPAALRETSLAGDRVTVTLGTCALCIAGPASMFVTPALRWPLFALAGVVGWRLSRMLHRQRTPHHDRLTGLYELRALLRHGAQTINGATDGAPVAVIGVDLNGFGAWNQEHGFTAGDALLRDVANALVALDTGPGVWGRVSSNRFSWIGLVADADAARTMARTIHDVAATNAAGLVPRVGLVICPDDAVTPENARAAVQECLEAARDADGGLVSFDGGLLGGASTSAPVASFRARRQRIADIIETPTTLSSHYQPIVHMATMTIAGYEALARINAEPRQGPDMWISEAKRVGLGLEFEAECIRRALTARAALPAGAYLSVNASPELVMSGVLDSLAPAGPLGWLMIEITEHDQVTDYGALGDRLDNMRRLGARVAVDDLGAGHSTLRHVMRMHPDYAKLDRSLVEGIDSDGAKRALVKSMVAFGRELRCGLVAEGVETEAEMNTLRGLGMDLGQGYLFQRPDPEIHPRLSAPPPVATLEAPAVPDPAAGPIPPQPTDPSADVVWSEGAAI